MIIYFNLFINTIDFLIYDSFLCCFNKKRRFNKLNCILLLGFCTVILTLTNQMENANLNMAACFILIYTYSLKYIFTISYHIILPILYIGFGFVAELISYFILTSYLIFFPEVVRYPISALICESVRFIFVFMVRQLKDLHLSKLPVSIGILLVSIPILSVAVCCIAMNIIKNYDNIIVDRLSLVLIIVMIASNILMYEIFRKLTNIMDENHNQEMLLQEAKSKEAYFHEVENCNIKIRTIKHNLKNQLIAVLSQIENKKNFSEEIGKIIEELNMSDKALYTSNAIFNTILSNKIDYAEKVGIKVDVSVLIPSSINMQSSDVGILLGNLLDNAIEACEKISKKKRWIDIKILYKNSILLLKICNSKDEKNIEIEKSSKRNYHEHGIGIPSIKKIVNKYDGIIQFQDSNEKFEVTASLYGIEIVS